MLIDNQDLIRLLKENQLLSEEHQVLLEQAVAEGKAAYDAVVDLDILAPEQLVQLVADARNLSYVNLNQYQLDVHVARSITKDVAERLRALPLASDERGLHVAMADPTDQQALEQLAQLTNKKVLPYLASQQAIIKALSVYTQENVEQLNQTLTGALEQLQTAGDTNTPISETVNTLLSYAYQTTVSDVHIQPNRDQTQVRFRKDGVLHDVLQLPIALHGRLVSRIKVMSNLRTDLHQDTQDGKLEFSVGKEMVDVRVSIVPTMHGEKVVLRILSENTRQFGLESLGFSETNLERIMKAINQPYGLILSTGPTGSGKTTTLYSILKLLNKPGVNITTIEDPIEYDMERVSQIQVNTKANLTFSRGLRSILRQDPDIILVGEIRDEETASIAINAAMTGHLVLSTLHTNDAATAIPRLIDMGIEPFLLASSINIVIAQRLVRRLHDSCRVSHEVSRESLGKLSHPELVQKVFGDDDQIRLYKGKGCEKDYQSGYQGRLGIYELLTLEQNIKSAIINRRDAADIRDLALENGMIPMLEDGLYKVKQGVTSIEEIFRVIK